MLRVYSELLPLAELVDMPVLETLASRSIQLLAAVRPGEQPDAFRLVSRARSIGLSVGLWPMLGDEHGRWLNPGNEASFEEFIATLLAGGDLGRPPFETMVLDLEPPIAEVRALLDGRLGTARAWLGRTNDARDVQNTARRALLGRLAERGIESFAAVVPTALLPGRAGRGWQRALGTPVDDLPYDRVSPMLYTSLLEGYGLGVVRREDARVLLRRWSEVSVSRLGERVSVSLGAVGIGALGDERVYRSVTELAEDVSIVRAAGCDDLVLFDLAGVLARPPLERWLDALSCSNTPPMDSASGRARALDSVLRITGVALDVAAGN